MTTLASGMTTLTCEMASLTLGITTLSPGMRSLTCGIIGPSHILKTRNDYLRSANVFPRYTLRTSSSLASSSALPAFRIFPSNRR
jgi:hypothetical protein